MDRGIGEHGGGTDWPGAERDLFGNAPRGRPDWSHRRGEPRLFAVLWMVYLMAASVVMLMSVAPARFVSPEITRPAARAMLVAAMAGVCIVWPVVRLSQDAPRRPGLAVGQDLVVLLVPVYALILPQGFWFLSNWPGSVIVALCLAFTAWAALAGAILTVSLRAMGGAWARAAWTAVFLAISLGSPVAAVAGVGAGVSAGAMASPLTSVLDIAAPMEGSGLSARAGREQWWALGVVFVAAGVAWGAACGVGLALGRERA